METRANYVWVGVVTLALLALLAGFIVWLAQLDQGAQNEYDILFPQSVEGLANGSQVTFSGVPVGQVRSIGLWKTDPEFVRVRIQVEESVPILVGTTATIQASFTGVSTILLDGAVKNAPAISCETTACPDGLPLIPPGRGGFGEIVANAPLLLERLATLTERLTEVLDETNQNEIAAILRNTNEITRGLSATAPQLNQTLGELEETLSDAGGALQAFEKVMESTDTLVNQEGVQLSKELRTTLKNVSQTSQSLEKLLTEVRPASAQLSTQTLPAADATMTELRATSKALRKLTERLENQGVGALVEGETLPDYEP